LRFLLTLLFMDAFQRTGLRTEILDAVRELGFTAPTPIQEQAFPQLLNSDRDLIALAQTGTGKTAAFGMPLVHHTRVEDKFPQALILCPTRELCLQITRDLKDFAKFLPGLKSLAIYGGASISDQIRGLEKGPQIVVGTPGRVLDLLKRKKLRLHQIERVVLDEADEMLTMGFQEDLDAILDRTPEEKQTLLFSATMSKEVERISQRYMKDPVRLAAARTNQGAEKVDHIFYMVQARDKYEVLKRIADSHPDFYGIVFCRTRRDTKEIANKLGHDGYNADAIHGDLSQAQRDEVMGKFRSGQLQILVATDVAARGLDVKDLSHVVNFNLPDEPEVYVHRSGRTGRAGKSGTSIAIIHTREQRKLQGIQQKTGIRFTQELVPTGSEICKVQLLNLIDNLKQVEINHQEIDPFLPVIFEKLEDLSREDLIKRFVSTEFNRFLSYYEGARDINLPSKMQREKKKRSREERMKEDYVPVYVNIGTRQNLTPARLIGLINNALDSSDALIGRINILKKFSFFEVEEKKAQRLIQALQGLHFNGVNILAEVSKDRPMAPPQAESERPKRKGDFKGKGKPKRKGKKKKGYPKNRGKKE
jgi:ATP-dependent RNA helicase DeaD